eukprot:gnl/TRDRNA2_/TRDRNA2_155174_c0_seq1.p1 gnl/TRDRNA2_/TRDRNA2_155174_c0~~gnl/TRDRNA2_/TRDRNA2_155174_c0_seq1.p1  ORF type:complete len:274 (+),score=27.78 gnl/TRDRNA2_/TRDRNA2_155174_c0_seq1:49-870(+)
MVTSLSSALSQMPDGFQLPELNWSMSGISSSSGSGSRDRSSGGFMPMPIVLSSAFARSGSSASRNDDEQPEGAEADWSIAGAPCGICEGLSWRERLFGFGICFAAGCFLTVAACGHWSAMFIGQGERFALTYTLGNILTIGSTFFLVGAQRQWSGMWAKNRRLASLGYVACTVWDSLERLPGGRPLVLEGVHAGLRVRPMARLQHELHRGCANLRFCRPPGCLAALVCAVVHPIRPCTILASPSRCTCMDVRRRVSFDGTERLHELLSTFKRT